ncbi:MAG TPA: serine hydrolase domain-containing protein [Kofleriaceae bacterium]|nr:serine hydrolase domain-containing protein [Kofleriaceae bacterium]
MSSAKISRRARRASLRRVAASLALALAAAPACYRAPTLTGTDQVHDPNIEVTAIKDNGLAAQLWPAVDNTMLGLIGNAAAPGCAVGIARGGALVYLQGYGKAELGGEDWGVATMGAVGSVSKTFTAAAVMRLDQLGWLGLADTVSDHLPTGNAALAAARIDDLLDHSSGVGGATQAAAFAPTWEATSDADSCVDGEALDCGAVARTLAEPRLAFAQYEASEQVAALGGGAPQQGVYSNVGYSVLGAIVDELADGTVYGGYEGLVWHQVGNRKTPIYHADNMLSLALTHSWRGSDIPHRAVGYAPSGGGGYAMAEAFALSGLGNVEGWEGPAGGWAMTIGDLTRFAVALNTAQIVDAGRLAAMQAIRTDLDGLPDHYGFGILLGTGANAPYWHGGQIGGHTAAWTWWPSHNGQSLGIALMCNRQDISPWTLRGTATTLAGQIANSAPSAAAPLSLPAVGASAAAGRTWALGTARAWQAAPRAVIAPITGLAYDLVLSSRLASGRLALTLGEAIVTAAGAVPASGRAPVDLGEATFRDPWFATRPAEVRLATAAGEVVVRDLVLEGAVAAGGARLDRVSLRGTLDARQLAALGGGSATSLCAQVANTDAACRPCADGALACVAVRYEHLDGQGVSAP